MRFLKLCLIAALLLGSSPLLSAAPAPIHGFDTANLDRSVKPTEDFYQFANGGWLKAHPIPEDAARWGRFQELGEKNMAVLREVLEAAAAHPGAPGSVDQLIGDLYASAMDTAAIEKAGLDPLRPYLDRIAAVKDAAGLQATVAELHMDGVGAMFNFGSDQDAKDSTKVIGAVEQGGLGLPDRDYYTRDDERSVKLREAYQRHVASTLALLGEPAAQADADAATVLAIETRMAKASMTRVQRRDPQQTYHKLDAAQLARLTPHFAWPTYFAAMGRPDLKGLNVAQPDFFKALDGMLADVPLEQWKTYLRWHLVKSVAHYLPERFDAEDFAFYGKRLSGQPQQRPRWKRMVALVDGTVGEALAQAYVRKTFTPQAKARVLEMVIHLQEALREDLHGLPWMSESTRREALAKLDAFTAKIGYPDRWRSYAGLRVERGALLADMLRANRFETARDLHKIGRPVDRTEWHMTPPTVNAYYNVSMNEIVFPAGILQPPFFDPLADDAVNYGGMGAVIGHEMTHGFDDHGAQFDGQGNLRNWWATADLARFQALAERVEKQFSGYEAAPGLHLNGKLVEGESIADLGGLTLAYAAFERSLCGKPHAAPIDGFTAEQRFFLGWAQVWATNARPEYVRLQVNTDPHPVARFRVNGPLSNMPAFAKAFGCKPGDAMLRSEAERCQIW